VSTSSPGTSLRHGALARELERLRVWADDVGVVAHDIVRRRLAAANELMIVRILPLALAEKEVLYPVMRPLIGAAAIGMLERDQSEMLRLSGELSALRREADADEMGPRFAADARRILYCLSHAAGLYLAKEDEILLPLLDARCTLAEAAELSAATQRAAARITAEA